MPYEVSPISLIIILLYLITYVLNKENVTTRAAHIKIWNFIILLSALILISFSLMHTFIIEYGIDTPLSLITLFWHVEFGLALVPIVFIHIYIYRKTFRKISLKR